MITSKQIAKMTEQRDIRRKAEADKKRREMERRVAAQNFAARWHATAKIVSRESNRRS